MKYLNIIALSLLLGSCSNDTGKENTESHENHEGSTATTNTSSFKDVDAIVVAQLDQIVQHYIHLKNGMVASSSAETKAGAKGMLDAISAVDTLKFTPDQKKAYDDQIGKIKENASHIMGSEDIGHQRGHLNPLSESTYNLIRSFGKAKAMYYQFCPMANDSKGGYWISETEEIKNPYFGDDMLTCGEVKETLK